MNIPGSNLLNLALTVINPQAVIWYRAIGRIENALGQFITAYAAPVVLRGSLQPLDRAKYEAMGLDMAKVYHTFYSSNPMEGIARGESPDYFVFNNRRLEVEDELDWYTQDGWRCVLLIDEGRQPASEPE